MLSLASDARILMCTQPTDMRRSFDGLHGMVLEVLGADPQSGTLFVFLNRRRDRVKILLWEGDGFSIWYKRLEAGTFQLPQSDGLSVALTSTQLAMLLGGVDLRGVRQRKRYRRAG